MARISEKERALPILTNPQRSRQENLPHPSRAAAGRWVLNHFYPVLKEELESQDADSTVFCWTENEVGSVWPEVLKDAHARSRLLIAVLTPPYFYKSPWCRAEWATMIQRQKHAGLGEPSGTQSLICPVLYSDGENHPDEAQKISFFDFRDWAIPDPVFRRTTRLRPVPPQSAGIRGSHTGTSVPCAPLVGHMAGAGTRRPVASPGNAPPTLTGKQPLRCLQLKSSHSIRTRVGWVEASLWPTSPTCWRRGAVAFSASTGTLKPPGCSFISRQTCPVHNWSLKATAVRSLRLGFAPDGRLVTAGEDRWCGSGT